MTKNESIEAETVVFLEDKAKISLQNGDKVKSFDEDDEDLEKFNPLYRQIFAASGVLLAVVCSGMATGFSAILLPQLREEGSSIKVTQEEESLIASMVPLPMVAGSMLGGWLMQKIGRKKTNIFALVMVIGGWIIIYAAQSFQTILIGRFISGFFLGAGGPVSTTFIAETSSPKYRGIFLAGISMSICLGLLLTHIIGSLVHWRTTCLIAIVFTALCSLMFLPASETYVWYSNKNRMGEAKKAFCWYRGYGSEAKDEYRKFIHSRKDNQASNLSWGELLAECKKRTFLKPLLIMNLFFLTMQSTGSNAVIFYTVSIMQDTVGNINSYAAMLIIDFLRFVISALACILSKKYRVRPLTMISGLGTAASLYLLAIAIYFAKLNPDNKLLGIISITMLLSYIIFVTIGLIQLPWALVGEIFPPLTKGIGAGLSTSLNFLGFFTVVQTGLYLFSGLGSSGAFAIYGSLTLLGTLTMYYILPETKGRTLREIEETFMKKKKINNNIIIKPIN